MEIRGIVRSIPFYVLLVFAMLNVLGSFIFSLAQIYGTPILPVTRAMLLVIGGSYIFMVYLIIIYYSGELVHRERQTRMSEIVDASPYPGGVMVTAKIGALWFIIVALLSVVGLTAMVVQVFNDYYFFELAVYGAGLFVNFGWGIFLLCVLAVFVQVLSPNKWTGMLIVLGLLVGFATLSSFGFEHSLYRFGAPPGPFSDMNGFGHFLERLVTVGAYWSAFAVLLTVGAHMALQRGSESRFRFRWRAARQRFNENVRTVAVLALAAWIGFGGWIFYNTNVLNAYETQDDLEELAAEYEKR